MNGGVWVLILLAIIALTALFNKERALLAPTMREAGRWLARNYVRIVFVAAFLVVLAALTVGLWRVPLEIGGLLKQLRESSQDPVATRNIVTALAAVLATLGILGAIVVGAIRVWTSERQIVTTEQGLVTERLTKAIEQLGAEKTVKRIADISDERGIPVTVESTEPNLEVRLGAIYALERIARDSERDHVTIMEIICAYIRENAKAKDAKPSPQGLEAEKAADAARLPERHAALLDHLKKLLPPRVDIQAALTVIGRRAQDRIAMENDAGFALDLRQSNLRRASLAFARLERINLSGALMEGTDLIDAKLEKADLNGARLEGANLTAAVLEAANLSKTSLDGASLCYANLHRAKLAKAQLCWNDLRCADLSESTWDGATVHVSLAHSADLRAPSITQDLLDGMIGNSDTLLPHSSDEERRFVWSSWEREPEGYKTLRESFGEFDTRALDASEQHWCCGSGVRSKVGRPLGVEAPRSGNHPIALHDRPGVDAPRSRRDALLRDAIQ